MPPDMARERAAPEIVAAAGPKPMTTVSGLPAKASVGGALWAFATTGARITVARAAVIKPARERLARSDGQAAMADMVAQP